MKGKTKKERRTRILLFAASVMILISVFTLRASAEDDGGERAPPEYGEFIGSLDDDVSDRLPDSAHSEDPSDINDAAKELSSPANILSLVIELFGEGLASVIPTLTLMLGITVIAALLNSVSSGLGETARAVGLCTRLCTFSVISGAALSCLERLSTYFERLFASVASFLPLSAALYAMGGNMNVAASSSASLGIVLTVCEFFCTKTVIPLFCVCLCLSLLSVFDGGGSFGSSLGGTIRKWYMTVLSLLMAVLTTSLGASNLVAAKADNIAMRGAKFAVSSFVPVTGGTLSSTLGSLAASVELLRGGIGVIGIVALLMLLLPVAIELALLRGVFAISGFCASMLGCNGEARLFSELESLYGFLEGVALLSAAIFILIFGIFACTATPFS